MAYHRPQIHLESNAIPTRRLTQILHQSIEMSIQNFLFGFEQPKLSTLQGIPAQ
jgi:hypothetical protein